MNNPKQETTIDWETKARELWAIIDDIDTALDVHNPFLRSYEKAVIKHCARRNAIMDSPDGRKLETPVQDESLKAVSEFLAGQKKNQLGFRDSPDVGGETHSSEQLASMDSSGLEYRAAFIDDTRLTDIDDSGLDDDDLLAKGYEAVKKSMGFGEHREYPKLKAKIKIGMYSEQ